MQNLNRNTPPPIQLVDHMSFAQPKHKTLDNGISAYFVEGGSQDIVRFELLFKSGSFHQSKSLQAFSTAHLLQTGTVDKSSEDINKLWDFYGVSLQIEAQKDLISVGFFCLTRHLDPVLDLLLEIVTKAIFPEDELHTLLSHRKQEHIVNQKKVQHLARTHFNELIFGENHPYGKMLQLQDFDLLGRADLVSFHHDHIHPANCLCFVAGRFPEDMTVLLNRKFEKYEWHINSVPPHEPSQVVAPVPGKHNLPADNNSQSSLRLGKLMINRSHPDYHKLSITNTLLGGYFGSRLMQNIRQDKGYTYGINSAVVSLIRASYFFIATQVGKDVQSKALEEIYHELKQLRTQPAGDEELTMLKNYLSAGFLRSFDGPFMQMERYKEILLFELQYSHYESFLPVLNNINAADIQEMAEKYLHENDMTELVVG